MVTEVQRQEIQIPAGNVRLKGDLSIPPHAEGLVIFAHGSGSSRKSSRNRFVAQILQEQNLATLLFDLLTEQEEQEEYFTRHLRFDIPLLAHRLAIVSMHAAERVETLEFPQGFFGASTGAAAALVAATLQGVNVKAVVSRGGRPDLAGEALPRVLAPTLLIVGGDDVPVIGLNQQAMDRMERCEKDLIIVPGASHLFEEPGTLQEAATLAADWFARYVPESSE
jgi:putative phosphoribosyl transferase